MNEQSRFRYVNLARDFLEGRLTDEELGTCFASAVEADPIRWAETPYRYVDWFAKQLPAGREHPNGFDYWLRAALPALVHELEHEADEIALRARFCESFWDDGYFEPSKRAASRGIKSRPLGEDHANHVRAFIAECETPSYWVDIADPDDCLSIIRSVRRSRHDDDVAARLAAFIADAAPQGGASYLVWTTQSLDAFVVHSWDPDELSVAHFA